MAKNVEGLHNDSNFSTTERFTTLTPALATYDSDRLADPPCFDGREPEDPRGFKPPMEKPGYRGAR